MGEVMKDEPQELLEVSPRLPSSGDFWKVHIATGSTCWSDSIQL